MNDLYNKTFCTELSALPSAAQARDLISELPKAQRGKQYKIREGYTQESFLVLTEDLVTGIQAITQRLNAPAVSELMCGKGWLSHWLNKYGVPVKEAVDNKTWPHFSDWPEWIHNQDATEYVSENSGVQLFIMSWPYMDDNAVNVWRAMKAGQYLLYFGEGFMGCTADEDFFTAVEGRDIDAPELDGATVRFSGLHDYPRLLQKT